MNLPFTLPGKTLQPQGVLRLLLVSAFFSCAVLFVSCSKLNLASNCLNEKSGCFKNDTTRPQFYSATPSQGQTVSTLDFVDITFTEELKNPQPGDISLTSPGDALSVARIEKISQYTYRFWISGAVQNGDITFTFNRLTDYNGNTVMGTLTLTGNVDISITFDQNLATNPGYRRGVSDQLGAYDSTTIRFRHDFDGDSVANGGLDANDWKVYRTTGVTACSGPGVTPLASFGATTLAANSYVSFTLNEATDFPLTEQFYRIVVCVRNIAKNKFGAQGLLILRDNSAPGLTISPNTQIEEFRNAQNIAVTCSNDAYKIAYRLSSFNTWLGNVNDPAAPADPDFTSTGDVDTAGGSLEYANGVTTPGPTFAGDPANPVRSRYKFRCIDIAGNKSTINTLTSPIYVIDNTLPEVTVSLDNSFRAYITPNIVANSTTTIRFTTNQPAGQNYKIKKGGTSCTAGGTDMVSGVTPATGSLITHTFSTGNAFNQFDVGSNDVRICVSNPTATKWGVATLTVTNDNSIPTTATNVASGTYGSLQSVEITCTDNADKIYLTSAEALGATVPTPPSDPSPVPGQELSGPLTPKNDRTTIYKWLCVDKAGQQSTIGTAQYTVDTVIPTVTVLSNEHVALSSAAGAYQTTNITFKSSRGGLIYRIMRGTADCVTGATQIGSDQTIPAAVNGVVPNVTVALGVAGFPTPGTNYDVKICVFNNAGTPGYNTANLQIRRDDTAPTILPANLSASITSAGGNSYTLSWNAADDTAGSGVVFYRIFRDSSPTPTFPGYPNTPDYTAAATTGLNSATIVMPDANKYYLRIVPVDAAGNATALAASYNIITTRLNLSVSVSGYSAGAGDFRVQQGSDTLAYNTAPGGTQTFATGFVPGGTYNINIAAQPSNQICSFTAKQFGTITGDLTLDVKCLQGQWIGGNYQATNPVPLNYLLYRGKVTTLAGNGSVGFADNGTGTLAQFQNPEFMVYLNNALYVADSNNRRVRRVSLTAPYAVTTIAGSATAAAGDTSDDGPCLSGKFGVLTAIATDGVNLYVSEISPAKRIRKISDISGTCNILSFAGSGANGFADGPAATAQFRDVYGLASDGTSLYASDNGNNRIRKIDLATGSVSTIAGNGGSASVDAANGTSASFQQALGMTVLGNNIYLADSCFTCSGNDGNKIRQISLTAPHAVTTVAGVGGAGGFADGPAATAKFNTPIALTTDGTYLFLADLNNSAIRRIDPQKNFRVSTLAGSGSAGHADGVGPAAVMNNPHGIASDGRVLYLTEWGGHRIKRLGDTGLLAYWTIDPGVNPNDYNSDNTASLHGSVLGGPLGTLPDRFGNANKASLFNGTTQSVSASATGLPTGNAPRTMCAWVKPTAAPTGTHIIATYGTTAANQTFGLYMNYGGGIQSVGITAFGGAPDDLLVPHILSTTEWTHLCAWANGTTGKLFLNGKIIGSYAHTFATGSTAVRIGSQQGNVQYFGGGIADVRIYGRALSEGEINELAQNAAAGSVGSTFSTGPIGMVAHYEFNQGAEDTASAPIGGNLTFTGTKAVVTGKDGDTAGSIYYNGSSYETGSGTGLPVGTAPRTLCGWLRLASQPAGAVRFPVISYGTAGTYFDLVYFNAGSTAVPDYRLALSDSGNSSEQASRLPINAWQHSCVTHDGSTTAIYWNGRQISSTTHTMVNVTSASILNVGKRTATAAFFRGAIDDVRIYNSALSQAQIRQLATQAPNGLVLRLDTNGDLSDVSGFGHSVVSNPGTLVSGRRGIADTAYRFVAAQQAQIASSTALMQQMDISWSFWMKSPDMTNVRGEIIGKYVPTPNSGWVVKYDQSNFAHGWTSGSGANGAFSNSHPVPSDNVWNHYAFVRSGAGLTVYINGSSFSNITSGNGSAIVPNNVDVNVGINSTGEVHLQDLRIYNRALSMAEVRALTGYHVVQSAAGLSLHVQADTYSHLSDGNSITTNWRNSVIQTPASGSGTVAGNPRYVSGVNSLLGGMPAIEFDGTGGKYFDFGYPTYNYSGLTVCAAATRKTTGYRGLVEKRGSNHPTTSWGMLNDMPTNALKFEMDSTASAEIVDAITDDNPVIYCVISGAGDLLSSYVNGQSGSSTSKTTMSGLNSDRLVVGSRYDLASSYFGQIGEAFVMVKDASVTERRMAECYLSAKYSIPLTGGVICP